MNEFDTKAAEWDMNPMHVERSVAVAKEIRELIPLKNNMKALEYGAGTGITSFLLRDSLKEIILMDSSTEMVKIMEEKIRSAQATNLKVISFDLEHSDYTEGKFDFIFTQMVLHHVSDIESITGKFRQMLNPGGYLAIADLYEEDGSFHGEGFTGHKGFNTEHLSGILKNHSFVDISHKTCFVIKKKISENEYKEFEVFLLTARVD
jgi:tRNA (cmo5U34)-methyltransferase